jgi:hypothetical protein
MICLLRARIWCHVRHELGIPAAEITRHLGICTSAIVKAIQNLNSRSERQ